jgi:hypothetical protein
VNRLKDTRKTVALSTSTLLVASVLSCLFITQSSHARQPIPDAAVKVAGGTLERDSWEIFLFGRQHRRNCWATRVVERGLVKEDAYCGFSVPDAYWQLAARGSIGSRAHSESLLFF